MPSLIGITSLIISNLIISCKLYDLYEVRQLRMLWNIVEKMQSNIHLTIDDNSSGTFAVQNWM